VTSTDAIYEALAGHYLFRPLDAARLRRLAQATRTITLDSGEQLFQRGDPANRFFLVGEGQIKLFRVSADGHEKVVEIMGPGETFAEAVMFMGTGQYPVSTQAIEPAVVYGISNATYLEILRGDTDACLQLLGDLSQRLHRRLNEIDTLTLQKAGHRVIRYLLERLSGDERQTVVLPAPKHLVASRLAIQPETFSRILLQLSQTGIVRVSGRRIEVLDPAALRRQVDQ
jgi:CRP-like cAMP-binding protein